MKTKTTDYSTVIKTFGDVISEVFGDDICKDFMTTINNYLSTPDDEKADTKDSTCGCKDDKCGCEKTECKCDKKQKETKSETTREDDFARDKSAVFEPTKVQGVDGNYYTPAGPGRITIIQPEMSIADRVRNYYSHSENTINNLVQSIIDGDYYEPSDNGGKLVKNGDTYEFDYMLAPGIKIDSAFLINLEKQLMKATGFNKILIHNDSTRPHVIKVINF